MAIRSDPVMASQVEDLNNHSAAVGAAVYAINDYQTRSEFVNSVAAAEGSSSQIPESSTVDKERRKKRMEEDEKFALERAEVILVRDKKRRNQTLSSQTNLKLTQREFFQNLISNDDKLEINGATKKKFPGTKNIIYLRQIKKVFYLQLTKSGRNYSFVAWMPEICLRPIWRRL